KVRMTVTQIEAGNQHNVIPAECRFVVDVRVTDKYSNQQVLDIVKEHVNVEVKARSLRLNSSSIPVEHPLVQAGIALGRKTYGSPTLSDQAVLSCPSLKLGPGDSLRSHTADEFIYVNEIEEGIQLYINLLSKIL
ncbi:MAG: peptidase dimerization domain-containing protein, partial [Flavobacteriaceae bacterium]|nr:peptidase dimerization domain-containing protein [Flavobacteriaceae bacterium]